jgi:MarR family transcriptional regulator, organic hydroperoxide resistance regulator
VDLVHLLTGAERMLSRRLATILDTEGRTLDEWRVLSLLADGAGHPMTELSERAFLPPASLTRLIDRLVDDNLLHRRVDDADRRRIRAFLTPRGRRLHQRLSERIGAELTDLYGRDAEPLGRLLSELIDALDPSGAVRLPAG